MPRRITPAHAGKTAGGRLCLYDGWDHPRACGENNSLLRYRGTASGSPPRMRGKPWSAPPPPAVGRITPAHAGKTRGYTDSLPQLQDHPRACGENLPFRGFSPRQMGSPPRMRGKLVTADFDAAMDGITPAHAGKTRLFPLCNYYNEDHPRACGENFGVCQRQATSEGSPPRMRGKLDTPAEETETDRITPAHAGKTAPRLGLLAVAPDHPRACGENFVFVFGR